MLLFIPDSMSDFTLTWNGKLCSDTGDDAVNHVEACKSAAAKLQKSFEGTEYMATWPKGCYMIEDQSYIFFNQHSTGSSNIGARQLCHRTGA